jgi:hypothetical protein
LKSMKIASVWNCMCQILSSGGLKKMFRKSGTFHVIG